MNRFTVCGYISFRNGDHDRLTSTQGTPWVLMQILYTLHEFFTWHLSQDFGVWNISYATVSCTNWAGAETPAALGSVAALNDSGCCPSFPDVCFMLNPLSNDLILYSQGNTNDTCPSYSDANGIPYVFLCILASAFGLIDLIVCI